MLFKNLKGGQKFIIAPQKNSKPNEQITYVPYICVKTTLPFVYFLDGKPMVGAMPKGRPYNSFVLSHGEPLSIPDEKDVILISLDP